MNVTGISFGVGVLGTTHEGISKKAGRLRNQMTKKEYQNYSITKIW